jgi:hypothetical protein
MSNQSKINFLTGRKFIAIFVIAMGACLITDTGIIKTANLVNKKIMNYWQIPIFIIISIAFLVSQYFLLYFIRKKTDNRIGRSKSIELNILWKVVFGTQVSMSVILLLVLYQVLNLHQYNILLLNISTILSYQLAVIMMGILAQQFFTWFAANKNIIILIYGLASVVIALSSVISMAFIIIGLSSRPMEVGPHFAFGMYAYEPGSVMGFLEIAYTMTAVSSFILMWIGTSLILRSYSFRLGKKFYWVIVSIPLAYFLSQFIPSSVSGLSFLVSSNPVFLGLVFTLIYTFSKAIGGFMFSIAFYIAARSVTPKSIVRDYMLIAAFGIVLFFLSGQTTITDASYPPFGLVSIMSLGLMSYLLFIGLYSSAFSVSGDVSLRKSIRNMVLDQSKFLERIGTAQMERQMQQTILNLAKGQNDIMKQESGVESSMTENEVKDYLQSVLKEVKKTTSKSNE